MLSMAMNIMHYLSNPITKNTLNKLCNMMIPRNEQNRRQTPNILIHVSRTGDPTDMKEWPSQYVEIKVYAPYPYICPESWRWY